MQCSSVFMCRTSQPCTICKDTGLAMIMLAAGSSVPSLSMVLSGMSPASISRSQDCCISEMGLSSSGRAVYISIRAAFCSEGAFQEHFGILYGSILASCQQSLKPEDQRCLVACSGRYFSPFCDQIIWLLEFGIRFQRAQIAVDSMPNSLANSAVPSTGVKHALVFQAG